MRNFYLIILAASGIYLIVQLFAWFMYKKLFFVDSGELFEKSRNRFQWQMIFPKSLPLFMIFIFVSAVFGLLLDVLGIAGWISLPFGVVGGLTINFIINISVMPRYLKARERGLPTDAELDGMEALVTEDIYPRDYGKIRVTHGGRSYIMDAILANETRILSGSTVIIIYAKDGLCFVESTERFCDVLFEDDEPPENTDRQDYTAHTTDTTEDSDGSDTEA